MTRLETVSTKRLLTFMFLTVSIFSKNNGIKLSQIKDIVYENITDNIAKIHKSVISPILNNTQNLIEKKLEY